MESHSRHHLKIAAVLLLSLAFAASALAADDQGTIFIIRHAEKLSKDPNALLSSAGHARANCLAHLLGEANIQTVFTSNIRRTHQTASPLAKARHLTIQTIPKDNPDELVQKAKAAAQNGDVLIVGHQETVADIVQRLGGGTVPRVGPNEFDRLTVLHSLHQEPRSPSCAIVIVVRRPVRLRRARIRAWLRQHLLADKCIVPSLRSG